MTHELQPADSTLESTGRGSSSWPADGSASPGLRSRVLFSWAMALLAPIFAVLPAMAYRIEEHATDMATYHIYRAVLFSAARGGGWLYPRWASAINNGLGGPLFTFYPPLLYYLLDAVAAFGVAHTLAWRLVVVLALLAASTGAFKLGLALFRRADIALVGAVVYVYAPYLLREFFERGSPQGLAMALLPWALWALLWLAERPSGGRLALASVLWAALVLAHTLSAILFAPVVAIFAVYLMLRFSARSLLPVGAALLLALLLTSFHVVPFLAERQFANFGHVTQNPEVRPALNPSALRDLLLPPPLFDTQRAANSMGQTVGPLHVLFVLLGLVVAWMLWRRRQIAAAWLVLASSLLTLALLLLQLDIATPLWEAAPAAAVVQFRWRLLGAAGLAALIVLGYGLTLLPARARSAAIPMLIVALIALELPMFFPEMLRRYTAFPARPAAADVQGWTLGDEMIPRWRQLPFDAAEAQRVAAGPVDALPGGARILASNQGQRTLDFQVESPTPFRAAVHLLYFPGWTGYVDGAAVAIAPQEGSGYTLLDIPAGEHTVALRYEGTPVERAASGLSLAAAIVLAVLAVAWRPAPAQDRPEPDEPVEYLRPRWWLAAALGLVLLAGIKLAWIDPHTDWLRCTSTPGRTCSAQASTAVAFPNAPTLAGYGLPSYRANAGDLVRVALFWRGEEPAPPVSAFAHIRNSRPDWPLNPSTGQDIWAQDEHAAVGGVLTSEFAPGKIYVDEFRLRLPENMPPGEYFLEIGWYDPVSGEQLDPEDGSVEPPLRVLWRSILLPSVSVE